jgi:hypothetical protein
MQAEHSKMIDAIWELVLSSATKITGMEDKLRNMLELNPNQAMQYQNDYALVADGEALDGPALEAARALQTLRTAFLMGNAIFYRLAGEVNKSQGEVGKAISAWLTAKGIPETESYGVLGAYLVYFGSANGEVSA